MAQTTVSTARDSESWLVVTVACISTFVVAYNSTAILTALPAIKFGLDMDAEGLQWVMNVYMLASAVLVAVMGRFADIFGKMRMFLIGLVEREIDPSTKIDYWGVALLVVTLGSFVYGLTNGHQAGWTSAETLGLFAIAVVGAIGLAFNERRTVEPLINFSFFRSPRYVAAATGMFLTGFVLIGVLYLLQPLCAISRRAELHGGPGRSIIAALLDHDVCTLNHRSQVVGAL